MQHRLPFALSRFLIAILLLAPFSGRAQITVVDNQTAAQLVQKLVGNGITYLNPVLTCPQGASANWGGVSNLGIDSGIVLTTGKAKTDMATGQVGVNGDQNTYFAATGNSSPGDPELTAISGVQTFDACKLEFDFVPDGDSLLFNYVFGSEEYDNYSCSSFNDVFAFFLSGPGITGQPNIALIPGTTIPVSINSTTDPAVTMPFSTALCQSMGPGSPFAQYYNDNSLGTTITYYGLTQVLTARAKVIPCTTYHIKLAIADGSDGTLDSGVFLAANSFRSNNIKLTLNSALGEDYNFLVEGCAASTITARRPKPFAYPQVIHLSYGGTATRDADYFNVPDSVVIPAYDTMASFVLAPIQDNIPEGTEYIIVRTLNPCNGNVVDSISIPVHDYLPFDLLVDDTAVCQHTAVNLVADGNVANDTLWNWNWRSTPASTVVNNGQQVAFGYPDTTSTYYISATYLGCLTDTLSFVATVEPQPIVNILTNDTTVCLRDSIQLRVQVGPDYFSNYNYAWSPGFYLSDPLVKEPKFFYGDLNEFKYLLAVQTPLGCTGKDSFIIRTRFPVDLINVTPDATIRYGDSIQLNAEGGRYYTWTPTPFLSDPNAYNPYAFPVEPTTYTVVGVSKDGCRDTAYVHIGIDYTMTEFLPTAFSPNGDGRNDVFHFRSLKFRRLEEFRVFNRWGQEVFSTTDPEGGWDGSYKGQPAEMGVYHYLIRVAVPDGTIKTFKGDVTLVR